MTKPHTDVLVIGGGVLGTFFAYHALKRQMRVVLLERHAKPKGATVRNFGQIVPSGLDRNWQQYGRESLHIYQDIQSRSDITVRHLGSLYIASDDEELALIEELRDINASTGYSSELWTPQQCCKKLPALRTDYCRGGLYFPDEISVNSQQMIHRLHAYLAEQSNLDIHYSSCVSAIEKCANDLIKVTTTKGIEFTSERVILCCGSEFQTLFPQHFRDSNLELVKLQMLKLKPQRHIEIPGNILTGLSIRRYESFSQCPSWDAIKSRESQDSFYKRWGVHILFKQESDGGIILGDSHEYTDVSDPERLNFELRGDINEYFIAEGQKIFDLPDWSIDRAWYGLYSQSRDPEGIFTKSVENNVHIVTGIGGKGMTSSAGFAKYYLEKVYHD